MNGAELPDGSKIKVEPADPDYKSKGQDYLGLDAVAKNVKSGHQYGPTPPRPSTEPLNSTEAKEDSGGDVDDLDDFFASLS